MEEIRQFIRRYFGLSSEETKNSSELSFHSSEVSFDTSEEIFLSSVGIFDFLGSFWKIPREMSDLAKMSFVLFLKKVHSWGGITEMVHGSFLSVL